LTQDDDDEFDPYHKALAEERFGEQDPHEYVDTAKANENIKALLEGAFDEEEEKPKRRLRPKKKVEEKPVLKTLADRLEALDVREVGEKDDAKEEDEEEEEEDDGTVEGLSVKLLPHQVVGVQWMMEKEVGQTKKNGVLPKGGILADDMGLGKTIQSIALIMTNQRPSKADLEKAAKDPKNKNKIPINTAKSTLVVAPLALIKQWESEIKSKVTSSHALRVLVHHGPSRTKRPDDLKKYDVVVTTYQILASEHAGSDMSSKDGFKQGCYGVQWYRVILDEAHTVKNRNAKSTQACYALLSHYRWCLTGTPMQNNLDELQSLIRFLCIKPYCEMGPWKDQITGPMRNGRGGLAMKRLNFFLKAFMKRRTKDVLKGEGALNPGGKVKEGEKSNGFQIVERKVESVVAKFDAKEQAFYDRLASRAQHSLEEMMGGEKLDYIGALVLLLRLRQACNHPQLMKASVTKDKDAITTGSDSKAGSKSADKEADDLADMLGGLSVKQKNCDICHVKLNEDELDKGIHCAECAEDISTLSVKEKKLKPKKEKKSKKTKEKLKARTHRNRRVVDDDDDDEEGDWLVPEGQRKSAGLGKAGDTDDENADGAGDFLGSDDSETDSEAEAKSGKYMKKCVVNLNSSEVTVDSEEDRSCDDQQESSSGDSASESEDEGLYNHDVRKNGQSLKNLVASTKIRHLVEILRKETPGHKVIVFSQFTTMLDLIEPFLKNEGIVFTRYDGSMRNDLREASLDRLRTDVKTRVLLCSLKCGSLGLNLTAASRVVILEPFWNPVSPHSDPSHITSFVSR